MPNKDLQGNKYFCPILNKKVSYEYMKKMKSFFDNYKEDGTEKAQYEAYGGGEMKQWLENTLKDERDAVYYPKKSRMDAGEENQFKKTHHKDKDNANPTDVNLPNIGKSSKHKYIMANKAVYESINEELNVIKYLIQYMNNNKVIK